LNQLTKIYFLLSNNRNLYAIEPKLSDGSKVFVYVARSRLNKEDRKVISFFQEKNFYTIVFAKSNSSESTKCDLLISKSSQGRDLGVLRDVARSLGLTDSKVRNLHLLMLNDSMIWDTKNLDKLLFQVQKFGPNCFAFPTESFFPRHHVQPYLVSIILEGRAQIDKYSKSFEWIRNLHWKRSFVVQIEYKLKDELEKRQWQSEVIAPYDEILKIFDAISNSTTKIHIRGKLNPNQHLWLFLGFFGIYGIKKSLLFSNPCNITDPPKSLNSGQDRMISITENYK